MKSRTSRRAFVTTAAGLTLMTPSLLLARQEQEEQGKGKAAARDKQQEEERVPEEADFERDYEPPKFKPSWKNKQVNRTMAQDFVIYAHSDLDKVKMLYDREPGLLNSTLDWGSGDWETALGGASHMGRVDIVKFLLSKGARMDIFCAAMLGLLNTVKEMLSVEPGLIKIRGPHGFSLNMHAQIASELGHENGTELLDHLQSLNELKLRPLRFLKK